MYNGDFGGNSRIHAAIPTISVGTNCVRPRKTLGFVGKSVFDVIIALCLGTGGGTPYQPSPSPDGATSPGVRGLHRDRDFSGNSYRVHMRAFTERPYGIKTDFSYV